MHLSTILQGLRYVGSALSLSDAEVHAVVLGVIANYPDAAKELSLEEWLQATAFAEIDDRQRHIVNTAIALAHLRESGRRGVSVSAADLERVWLTLKSALQCPSLSWTMTRSAQGLLAIPMWSLIKDGCIDELIRVHIWLPDGVRADPDMAIHLHQPFGQSWILAGKGTDHIFDVTPASEVDATHAEYNVGWKGKDDNKSDQAYKVHSKSSTASNTGKLVRVVPLQKETHSRNMSYCVPAGTFHSSEVEPDALHATIFFFDSSRGYVPDAAVIGPISRELFTHVRKSTDISLFDAVNLVASLRSWEILKDVGLQHAMLGDWEEALRSYRTALHVCKSQPWIDSPRYSHFTLGKVGHMYRMLGLYTQACECLEEAVIDTPMSRTRLGCLGELAVVYRHMNRLQDSKWASQEQYNGAKEFDLEDDVCRAVGTLGMVNCQLYLLTTERELLESAISQLEECVSRAQQLKDVTREAIGHGRLSVCYIAKLDYENAVASGQRSYDLMQLQRDASKISFAGAFFGRTLLLAGRDEEALALFNPSSGCPPVIALCREISDEHRQYIIEIIAAGADLKLRDDHGYTALECAMYNGDHATAKIIEEGLRAQILREGGDVDQQIKQFQYEATLRKGYRDIFQDKLRPVLLQANPDSSSALQSLRKKYAAALTDDLEKQRTFDRLKYVTYSNFLRSNRLPKSNHGYTQYLAHGSPGPSDPFILFFSYRWIAKDVGVQLDGDSPDDFERTQYRRMLRAIELFLNHHPVVDREQLCIWIDFACVDQDHQQPGVASLPMNLAQCNAMISLVDDKYYKRSWCCVEVLMIQTLQKAYGIHVWYEHVIDFARGEEHLRPGPCDLEVNMAEKQVTFEQDRPKLLFLERQTRLLG
ncbi:hypothetical protein CC86DRAFT_296404 [Ophiobolus disseminans]|uniref:Heterokaryon incompatibility domain-containing protein n=1 Tax=Ophiobolus disseminans TaxID=1469910 RepID=A0A6A6ZWJ1_9PLEO|nr:hypothetical protein CC86DRAFT_296404 [Ophiobolus disseminans]